MASNSLPTNSAQLIGLARKMENGIVKLGAAVPVTMVTAAQMQTDLEAFVKADTDFNAARSARLAVSEVFQAEMETVYRWLLAVSNTLASRFGTKWSAAWAQAGFVNGSTGVPTKLEERLGLVLSLVKFFTKNPGFEVPTMEQTAAFGTALQTTALAKQQVVTAAEVALGTAGEAWTTAHETLTGAMRELIKNLEGKLKKNDPRWVEFGLNMPGARSTPGQPVEVSVQTDETGALVAQCEAVVLAKRYRWRMQIVGVQEKYELAASTTEPVAVIGGVAAGQTVQIVVQAVSGNLQGVASEPVIFTLPVARAAGFRNLVKTEEAASVVAGENASGNGHENGHGRHARAR